MEDKNISIAPLSLKDTLTPKLVFFYWQNHASEHSLLHRLATLSPLYWIWACYVKKMKCWLLSNQKDQNRLLYPSDLLSNTPLLCIAECISEPEWHTNWEFIIHHTKCIMNVCTGLIHTEPTNKWLSVMVSRIFASAYTKYICQNINFVIINKLWERNCHPFPLLYSSFHFLYKARSPP